MISAHTLVSQRAASDQPQPHIVVVEDDDSLRELLTLQITDLGLKVTPYKDGGRFREELLFMKPLPQFILLDLMLPRISGLEVLKSIRETPQLKHLPVAILTGYRDEKLMKACLKLGVKDFMIKPIPEEVLRSRLACFQTSLSTNDARSVLSQCIQEAPHVFDGLAFRRFKNKGYKPYLLRVQNKTLVALMDNTLSRDHLMKFDEDMLARSFRIYLDGAPWMPVWPQGSLVRDFQPLQEGQLRQTLGSDLFDLVSSCASAQQRQIKGSAA